MYLSPWCDIHLYMPIILIIFNAIVSTCFSGYTCISLILKIEKRNEILAPILDELNKINLQLTNLMEDL